jgi:hypothetical protein
MKEVLNFCRGFPTMIEITVNDRLGKKVRVKCNEDDTIGDLKKLVAAQTGTRSVNFPIEPVSVAAYK